MRGAATSFRSGSRFGRLVGHYTNQNGKICSKLLLQTTSNRSAATATATTKVETAANRSAKIRMRIEAVTAVAATTIIATKIDVKSRTADTNEITNANKTAFTAIAVTTFLRNVGTISQQLPDTTLMLNLYFFNKNKTNVESANNQCRVS